MNSGKLPFLASGAFCLFLLAGCSNESEHSSSSPALTAEPARSPIIRQNTNCGGCDPSCYGMSDTPTGADLNEDNSENLRYDLDRDGLVATGAVGTYSRRYDA